jgi:hypothetical protein
MDTILLSQAVKYVFILNITFNVDFEVSNPII